jgi:hypothetical protein
MKRTFYCMLAIVYCSVAATAPLKADERGEIKNKLEQLRLEARELANRGEEDAASERMKMVRELNARLRTLAQEQPEVQRQERMEMERREREEMLHQLARRVEHLRVAAQHLKEAEMPDMAHELGRRADEMEHKLRVEKERFAADLEPGEKRDVVKAKEKMPPIVGNKQPREEHPRLTDEHDGWGRKVKEELVRHSEVINDIRAEQEKMRREFKELRQLIERLHKDKERG